MTIYRQSRDQRAVCPIAVGYPTQVEVVQTIVSLERLASAAYAGVSRHTDHQSLEHHKGLNVLVRGQILER